MDATSSPLPELFHSAHVCCSAQLRALLASNASACILEAESHAERSRGEGPQARRHPHGRRRRLQHTHTLCANPPQAGAETATAWATGLQIGSRRKDRKQPGVPFWTRNEMTRARRRRPEGRTAAEARGGHPRTSPRHHCVLARRPTNAILYIFSRSNLEPARQQQALVFRRRLGA